MENGDPPVDRIGIGDESPSSVNLAIILKKLRRQQTQAARKLKYLDVYLHLHEESNRKRI